MNSGRCLVAACVCAVLAAPSPGNAGQGGAPNASRGLSNETRLKLMESLNRGAAYILKQQNADGTFDRNDGVTAVAAAALMRQTGASKDKQLKLVGKTLDHLAALAKPDGGIYVQQIPHYITAVSVSALAAAGRPKDKRIIDRGRQYLVEHMLDEGEGIGPGDKWYGGMSYGDANAAQRADVISLEYGLQALKDADLPSNSAAWAKAIAFLQRAQNNTETNDQKWASDDGGFVYLPGFSYNTAGGTRSYGSATYAGVMSYVWSNVKKDDQRVQAVQKWIRENYSVDENPGMGQKTVYYYYMVFAKALQAIGEPVIVDAGGRAHNWREELGRKLLALQQPEGYWVNTVKDELQDNKVLVTAFTMMALEATLQQ